MSAGKTWGEGKATKSGARGWQSGWVSASYMDLRRSEISVLETAVFSRDCSDTLVRLGTSKGRLGGARVFSGL